MRRNLIQAPPLRTAWAILALAIPLTACGSSGVAVAHPDPEPRPMPAGGDWTGVYCNPAIGILHLTTHDGRAEGAWRTPAAASYGELEGEISGNLLRYGWTERNPTKQTSRTGRGYFIYTIIDDTQPHELRGERYEGERDAGSSWSARKRADLEPDLRNVLAGFDGEASQNDDEPLEHSPGTCGDEDGPVP